MIAIDELAIVGTNACGESFGECGFAIASSAAPKVESSPISASMPRQRPVATVAVSTH